MPPLTGGMQGPRTPYGIRCRAERYPLRDRLSVELKLTTILEQSGQLLPEMTPEREGGRVSPTP